MKRKYENKNEFYCLGKDYESYLNTKEDFEIFNQLKEIEESGELAKPANECSSYVIKFLQLERKLIGGAPVYVVQKPSDLSLN